MITYSTLHAVVCLFSYIQIHALYEIKIFKGPLENPEVLLGTFGSIMGKTCASDARRSFTSMESATIYGSPVCK